METVRRGVCLDVDVFDHLCCVTLIRFLSVYHLMTNSTVGIAKSRI